MYVCVCDVHVACLKLTCRDARKEDWTSSNYCMQFMSEQKEKKGSLYLFFYSLEKVPHSGILADKMEKGVIPHRFNTRIIFSPNGDNEVVSFRG